MAMLVLACNDVNDTTGSEFEPSVFAGEKETVKKAEQIFKAIGGKEKWALLKSVYIKAHHEEPEIEGGYTSEIWRGIDEFKIRIEQQNADFHTIGIFTDQAGWVSRLHTNSTRKLSPESLDDWKYQHRHNVYVLLNTLSKAGTFEVISGVNNRIDFFKGDEFLCAFEPDSLDRPHVFIFRNQEGKESVSRFSVWEETNGLVHSAGGGPLDGSFKYRTEAWVPSINSFDESFDLRMDLSADKLLKELNWMVGKWKNIAQDKAHFEVWKRIDDGLSGTGFALRNQDTVFSENIQIEIRDAELYFMPAVADQNDGLAIPFKWATTNADRYVFSNPEHDFPQYIAYELSSHDSMHVTVWGKVDGVDREINFVFGRIMPE